MPQLSHDDPTSLEMCAVLGSVLARLGAMLTVYVSARVGIADAERAMALGADEGFTARHDARWETGDPSIVVLEYQATFPQADSSGPEQRQAVDRVYELLSAAGIWFEQHGNGVGLGDGLSKSRFVIKPHGSTDPAEWLTIFALDRADFERQWNLFASTGSGIDLADYDVEVTGLAAND